MSSRPLCHEAGHPLPNLGLAVLVQARAGRLGPTNPQDSPLRRSAVLLRWPTPFTTPGKKPQLWKVFELYGMSALRCTPISMQVLILLDGRCILISLSPLKPHKR